MQYLPSDLSPLTGAGLYLFSNILFLYYTQGRSKAPTRQSKIKGLTGCIGQSCRYSKSISQVTHLPVTHIHILRRDAGDSLTSLLNDLRRTMVYTSLLFRHIDRICYFSPADVLVISSQTVSGGGYELCSGKYSNDGLIIPRFRFPALYFEAI